MKNRTSINLEISLFEIIISILIFAVAGVIILNCFLIGRYIQIKSNDETIAGIKAESILEYVNSMKTFDEINDNFKKSLNEYNNEKNAYSYLQYYNENWQKSTNNNYKYFIETVISTNNVNSGEMCDITVMVKRIRPYPFIGGNNVIFSVSSKKFLPKNLKSE